MRTPFSTHDLSVRRVDQATEAMIQLWSQTHWGDRGSRYQIPDIQERLAALGNPYFFTCSRGNELIGAYACSRRCVKSQAREHDAIYRTAFAIADSHRGRGVGKIFASEVKRILATQNDGSQLSYGFVDSRNVRSLQTLRGLGYQKLGSFEPLLFYRRRPTGALNLKAVTALEMNSVVEQFYDENRAHSLVWEGVPTDEYYQKKLGGRRVAGVGVHPVDLRLTGWGSFLGSLLLRFLKTTPGLRRYFGEQGFRMLAFDRLYFERNHEHRLLELMEGLLQKNGLNLGLIFLDPRSEQYFQLKQSKILGLLDRCFRSDPVYVLGTGLGKVSDTWLQQIAQGPLYISANDVL